MQLAGGIMGSGYQCGMLWGGALAAGAQAYRLYGAGARAEVEALLASQKLVETFRARAKDINCAEITELEWKKSSRGQVVKFLARGGPIGCFRLAADYAQIAFDTINHALGDEHTRYAGAAGELHGAAGAEDGRLRAARGHGGGTRRGHRSERRRLRGIGRRDLAQRHQHAQEWRQAEFRSQCQFGRDGEIPGKRRL